MTTEYQIKTVNDFMNLPEDKFLTAVENFIEFYLLVSELKKNYPESGVITDRFIWIDDGEHGVSGVRIANPDSGDIEK